MTSPEQPAAPGDDAPDVLEQLNALLARTNDKVTTLKAMEKELDQLVQLPPVGAAVATFDEHGLLASLEIDPAQRALLDAPGLVHDINLAIVRAERPTASMPAREDSDPQAAASLIESIFAGLTSGLSSEPVVYSNDLGTVTVTTMWGEILSVNCAPSWISAASAPAIAEEIVRVANLALRADDPMKRRSS